MENGSIDEFTGYSGERFIRARAGIAISGYVPALGVCGFGVCGFGVM